MVHVLSKQIQLTLHCRYILLLIFTVCSLCDTVDPLDEWDVGYMFQTIAETFSGIVQYARGNDLINTCNELRLGASEDYTRLARFIKNRRPDCSGNYNNFVQYFQQVNLEGDSTYKSSVLFKSSLLASSDLSYCLLIKIYSLY